MAAHPLRPAAALGLRLDGLEHPPEVARVVPRARHDLRAQQVGLLLVLAAVLHQPRTQAELTPLADDLSPAAADHRAGDGAGQRADLKPLRLGGVGRAMPQQDVTELVRHDAGDFAFA